MITNTAKPASSSLTNTAKVGNAETWATWGVAWQDETRIWNELRSTMDNTLLSGDPLWSYRTFPWQLTAPWQNTNVGMTNTHKPV